MTAAARPPTSPTPADDRSPVVIGGLGGSGTRAVSRIVERGGRFMGARLNESHDALDLADFDKAHGPRYIRRGDGWRQRRAFNRAVQAHLAPRAGESGPWGWKHPHSYLFIEFLDQQFSDLRFIHVIRDGRDMPFSDNQRQLRRYGEAALGTGDDSDPIRRINFWAWANLRAASDGRRVLGDRYLQVRLEDLCERPAEEVARLNRFVGADPATPPALDEVERPRSLGRWREEDPDLIVRLETAAGQALQSFGYELEGARTGG